MDARDQSRSRREAQTVEQDTRRSRFLTALALGLLLTADGCQSARQDNVEVAAGRQLIDRHGCAACHAIPGIEGARGNVGPPLDHMARRGYVAGVLANTPDNMQRWLRDPPAVDPLTAMPALGLSGAEARAIAAYLHTLD